MVTTVYFVRHAEATGNVDETFQGRTDTEVTERGKRQLALLAERFRDIPIERLYSSPMKRTISTAEAVNLYHGLEILRDERLIEIDGGGFEGQKWSELPKLYPEEFRLWNYELHNFRIENGECMTQVRERVESAVDDIVRRNAGRTIAVVSHGCALRNYYCCAMGLPISHLTDNEWSDNTAVSLITYDDSFTPSIVYLNDNSHLDEETSTLSRQSWWRITDSK